MFLKEMELTDWRAYASAALSFAPLTVIRGANHSGKSSLAQAIQIALGGRSDGTDAKGAGACDKVRIGADKAKIELTIAGAKDEVKLRVGYSGISGRRSQDSTNPAFLQWMDMQKERLRCALDTEYFISQKEQQKNILASLVLPTTTDKYDADFLALAQKHFQVAPDGVTPVAFLDNVYQLSFRARTEAKAALNAIYIPAQPPQPQSPATSEEIQEHLAKLRKKAEKLAKKATDASNDAAIARVTTQIEALQEKMEAADKELSELRPMLTDVESDILSGPKLKDTQQTANRRAFLNQLSDKAQGIIAERDTQREIQQMFREMLDNPTCPTCKQTISAGFINDRIAEHKRLEEEAGAAYNSLLEEQQGLGDVAGSEKLLAAHSAALERQKELKQEIAKHQKIVTDSVGEIAKKRNELDNLKAAAETPASDNPFADSELPAIHADIERYEGFLRSAITHEATLKQIEETTARKKAQQVVVDELEHMVAYSGKDGLKAKLIAENNDAFLQTVNSVLATWGYTCALSFEPYAFTVTKDGKTLPVKELSGSEAMFFGIALQCAIAVWSKIRCVVIDKADTLLGPERDRLFGMLHTLITNGTLAQAIVMISSQQTNVPPLQGTAFYLAEAGTLKKLEFATPATVAA